MKITFLNTFDTFDEKTWSGTTMAVYNALCKKYQVEVLHVNPDYYSNSFRKFSKFCSKYHLSFISKIVRKVKMDFKIYFAKKEKNIFCFKQFHFINKNVYVYIDMTFSCLLDEYNNHFETHKYWDVQFSKRRLKTKCFFQNRFLRKCKKIFCMSSYISTFLSKQEKIKNKVVFVGGGLRNNFLLPTNLEKKNQIVFIGNVYYRKSGPLVMDAFKIFHEKHPEFRLIFAGHKPIQDLPECILQTGFIKYEDVNRILNESKIFVCPSVFEPFGLVFLEATAAGCICIGGDRFDMPRLVSYSNGYTINPFEKDAVTTLSNLFERAYKDYKNTSFDNLLKFYKENSWESVIERMNING